MNWWIYGIATAVQLSSGAAMIFWFKRPKLRDTFFWIAMLASFVVVTA